MILAGLAAACASRRRESTARPRSPTCSFSIRVAPRDDRTDLLITARFRGDEDGETVILLPRDTYGTPEMHTAVTSLAAAAADLDAGDQPYRRVVRHLPGAEVELTGEVEAKVHLKGVLDTAGIREAKGDPDIDMLLNGLYLENAGEPSVEASSNVGVGASLGIDEIIEGKIVFAPTINIELTVPEGTRLRPFVEGGGIGCAAICSGGGQGDAIVLEVNGG